MSIDDKVAEENNERAVEEEGQAVAAWQRVKYLRSSVSSFFCGMGDSSFSLTALTTRFRKYAEESVKDYNVSYRIGTKTGFFTIMPAIAGSALAQPRLLYALAATNLISIGYELQRKYFSKKQKQHSISNSPVSFLDRIRSSVLGYLLAGAIALTHYNLSALFRKEEFSKEEVNFEVHECSFQPHGRMHGGKNLYLLGEQHQYNYSSSWAARAFLQNYSFDALLLETSKRRDGFFFHLLGAAHFIVEKGSGSEYPNPGSIGRKLGIPCFALEDDNRFGTREGLSQHESVTLGTLFAVGTTILAPMLYFTTVPLRYISRQPISSSYGLERFFGEETGLMRGRETAMTREAANVIKNYGFQRAAIITGIAHVSGMQDQLKKYGNVHCRKMALEEILR